MQFFKNVFGVWRLTSLVTRDEITQPLRDKVDELALGKPYGSFPERFQYLINCPLCASVWAGALVVLLAKFPAGRFVVEMLALSQLVILGKKAVGEVDDDA